MTDPDEYRLARVVQLIGERADLPGLKVLDLACRTGLFSAGLFDLGAAVVGIEGRAENLAQVRSGTSVDYEVGDVRDLDTRTDRFDVTLCLGILYHLEPEAALRLLTAMRKVTSQFAIIDTHIGTGGDAVELVWRYRGSWYDEPDGAWSAIGNRRSFWFTEASLDDAIRGAGWDHIEHIPGKGWPGEADDRRWLVIS